MLKLFSTIMGSNRRGAPAAPARAREMSQPRQTPMRDRYEAMTRAELASHHVRVHRWRKSMSGCAWEVRKTRGEVVRLIEAPQPRGPMSAAIFLHEIGHHAIGLHRHRPRCLEEHRAWMWALESMRRWDLNITPRVRTRVLKSLQYAVAKAQRRGLKHVPPELAELLDQGATGTRPMIPQAPPTEIH